MRRAAFAAFIFGLIGREACAERLVIATSSQDVAISSNFTGTDVTVFGVIERDAQSASRSGSYDIVITVRGPREAITIRRKEALGPIWLNRDQQKFVSVPAFLGVYANRPIARVVAEPLARKSRIGIDAIVNAPDFTFERGGADDPFRTALVRLKARDKLYMEDGAGAVFVTDTFFRARIALPETAPIGRYDVEAALLSGGAVLARQETGFTVMKAGIEDRISQIARDHALLYGLGTAAIALAFGWIASVIFRRD